MQERRQQLRVPMPVLVEFQDLQTRTMERTFTQDVSESGMRFPTSVKLQIGQELPLTIQLSVPPTTLRATGAVVWIREVSRVGGPQYEVGVRFQWVEDPDREQLKRHLTSVQPSRA